RNLVLLSLFVAASQQTARGDALPIVHKATHGGIAVTMTCDRVATAPGEGPLRERDDVRVRVEMTDEATHAPVRGIKPAVWLDNGATGGRGADSCRERINAYAGSSFLGRAEVDLNTFRVVSMNNDATLSVVDPLFGFGGTKLLAMVALPSPADDWSLTDDMTSIFVSSPAAKQVSRVETGGWTVAKSVTLPSAPHRVMLQPDEGYVWTATDDALVALRPRDLSIAASLPLEKGRHDVAGDNRLIFATSDSGVTIVDVAKLAVVKRVPIASPASIAWSSKSANAYVASETGSVFALNRNGIVKTMKAAKGLSRVRSAPDGRFVLTLNPLE